MSMTPIGESMNNNDKPYILEWLEGTEFIIKYKGTVVIKANLGIKPKTAQEFVIALNNAWSFGFSEGTITTLNGVWSKNQIIKDHKDKPWKDESWKKKGE